MKKEMINRKSQRSYNGIPLNEIDEHKLMKYISDEGNMTGVHGHIIKVKVIKTSGQQMEKISTYGVVKNAPSYLITVCKNNEEAMIDCGYVFEKLVLYLESIGVSTCWLGGTFKRQQLNVSIGEDEFIPIISPVGYGTTKKTFSDKTVRYLAKSDSRKSFDELFFYNNFNTSIKDETTRELLEYVRKAPSASNKQPWRIVIDEENRANLYLERTPNYGYGKLGYDIQMVDMGIALCHYELAKGSVKFVKNKGDIPMISEYTEYIMSMI